MKIILLIVSLLALCSCQRKQDQVAEAAAQNPSVSPPAGPVCTQHPFTRPGEFDVHELRLTQKRVFVPEFDLSKDTLSVTYKCSTCDTWKLIASGSHSEAISYEINNSTVTLSNLSVGNYDWMVEALVLTCK